MGIKAKALLEGFFGTTEGLKPEWLEGPLPVARAFDYYERWKTSEFSTLFQVLHDKWFAIAFVRHVAWVETVLAPKHKAQFGDDLPMDDMPAAPYRATCVAVCHRMGLSAVQLSDALMDAKLPASAEFHTIWNEEVARIQEGSSGG